MSKLKLFSTVLRDLLDRRNISITFISKEVGIDASQLSRILKGQYRSLSTDHIRRLCKIPQLSGNERFKLLCANLMDHMPTEMIPLVDIRPTMHDQQKVATYWTTLRERGPESFERNFELLRKICLSDAKAMRRVEVLIDLLREASSG